VSDRERGVRDLLPAEHRARLLACSERVEVPARTVLLREGDPSHDLYVVQEGEFHLRRNQLELKTLGPGDHFGALALLTGLPRTASVYAATPATLARVSPRAWESFASSEPVAALRVLQWLLADIRDDLTAMTDSLGMLLRGRSLPRARDVEVVVGEETRRVPTGTRVEALLPAEVDGAPVVAGLLGQYPVSLATPVLAAGRVSPLTAAQPEGRQIYALSVGLLLLEAADRRLPGAAVRMGPSRGRRQEVVLPAGVEPTGAARSLAEEMRRIVEADLPIRTELWTLEEAAALFRERGWDDAALLLRTRRSHTVPLVTLGRVYAPAPGPLLPSTGHIRDFGLEPGNGGLLLDLGAVDPRGNGNGNGNGHGRNGNGAGGGHGAGPMAEEHARWLARMGVDSVGAFNQLCIDGQVSQLIRVAEGFQEKSIGRIADAISSRRDRLRVVAIAGPSSSGKTTFIKRLSLQLQIVGLEPVGLSLDDYYVDRERTVRGEDGEHDFESIEALDLPLLQDHVRRLLAGEEVVVPRFDFKAGRSRPGAGPTVRLGPGDLLVLEGIHGLAPRLLEGAAGPDAVFRIFVHPATSLPADRLTRVSATDVRLLRRIVRDRHARGIGAAETILRWPAVVRAERLRIFPFQDEADEVFDTALVYEPAVLKVYAERYLLEVPPEHPAWSTAVRLRHLLDLFVPIHADHVPPTSLLREFVGGSGFEY
jgi:uridine kinase